MQKSSKKSLVLGRETVRHLSHSSLVLVAGGKLITGVSGRPECISVDQCPTTTCGSSGVFCQ